MSRMNEQSQQEDERENLSGADDYEAWMHEIEKNSANLIMEQENDKRRAIQQTQTTI